MQQVVENEGKQVIVAGNKIVAIQQRVANNDMTINQVRQLFGSVERRFSIVEKVVRSHKNLTQKHNALLAKITGNKELA